MRFLFVSLIIFSLGISSCNSSSNKNDQGIEKSSKEKLEKDFVFPAEEAAKAYCKCMEPLEAIVNNVGVKEGEGLGYYIGNHPERNKIVANMQSCIKENKRKEDAMQIDDKLTWDVQVNQYSEEYCPMIMEIFRNAIN